MRGDAALSGTMETGEAWFDKVGGPTPGEPVGDWKTLCIAWPEAGAAVDEMASTGGILCTIAGFCWCTIGPTLEVCIKGTMPTGSPVMILGLP